MRLYSVPPDTRGKEKIIGGYLTLTQFAFLVLAVVLGLGSGLLIQKISNNIKYTIVGIVLVALPFIPFAFYKIRKMNDMELFMYCLLVIKNKMKQKNYANINEYTDSSRISS